MKDSLKEQIDQRQGSQGFIKVTDNPVSTLTPQQKALLNRKGNVLFNQGQIDSARRIFTTTGYSDGLTRVGDRFASENNELSALKQYVLAHNKSKTEPIYEKLAKLISVLLKE